MAIYAMINDNKVDNVIVADAAVAQMFIDLGMWQDAEAVTAQKPAGIGWEFNPAGRTFTAPA
jgi:hypothetical protein